MSNDIAGTIEKIMGKLNFEEEGDYITNQMVKQISKRKTAGKIKGDPHSSQNSEWMRRKRDVNQETVKETCYLKKNGKIFKNASSGQVVGSPRYSRYKSRQKASRMKGKMW